MPTRRTFLKQSSLATAALFVTNKSWFNNDQLIGLQLYTMRNEIAKDIEGTIAKVASVGYTSVEVFGYGNGKFFGKTPEEFSAILKKNNLKTPSGHYMFIEYLGQDNVDVMKQTVADAAKMGHDYIVIPFLLDNIRTSLDDYKKLAAKFNIVAEEAKKAGLKFAYHNHNFEFKDWGGGKTGYDVFRTETDASLVKFEVDFYWVVRAGIDPLKIIKDNAGRVKLWHVKDMEGRHAPTFTTDGEQFFTEVGSGTINYKEIFTHCKESGMEYFYVEQDQVKIPIYESITKSFNSVKQLSMM